MPRLLDGHEHVAGRVEEGPDGLEGAALEDLDIALPRGAVLFAVQPDSAFVTPGETLEVWPTQSRNAGPRPTEILLYARS